MINLKQIIGLLPLLTIGLTVVITMAIIAWKRNHFINAILSILGLKIALFFTWLIYYTDYYMNITTLIYINNYSTFHNCLIIISSIASCIFAFPWLKEFKDNKEEFYLLILIATLGGLLVSNANHLVSLFLGTELMSIPLFGLIYYNFNKKSSLEPSIKYFVLSSIASSFFLFGMALFYAYSGKLSLIELGKNLSNNFIYNPLLLVSLSFITIGFSFKLSLAPFHLWIPEVYQHAPTPVTFFLNTSCKISIISIIMRILCYTPIHYNEKLRIILSFIACISIILGNLMGIVQNDIKRLISCSSIAHMGYISIALIPLNSTNDHITIENISIYLINYLFSNIALFGVISIISNFYNNSINSINRYRGLFYSHPVLSLIITIIMMSLAGIPMTLGFFSKFYLFVISIKNNFWWLTIVMLIGSGIGIYYYLRMIINLYLSRPEKNKIHISNTNYNNSIAIYTITSISTLIVLIFGIYPKLIVNFIRII